jgi:phosphoribosylamine--glycine ligase
MGDPETEVVMPRIANDLLPLLQSLKDDTLHKHECLHTDRHAATIMLVSAGYPEDYEKGKCISGIEEVKDSMVFHAGTKKVHEEIQTNGGRVIAISSMADTLQEAIQHANADALKINFEGKYFRKDIGWEFA